MKAVLIFHAPNLGDILHPFLVKEIKLFSEKCEEVHLICQKSKCGYSDLNAYKNVVIHDYSADSIRRHILFSFPCYLSKTALEEYKVVYNNNKMDLRYWKDCVRLFTVGDYIFRIIFNILKKDKSKDWIIDSYWFSNGAYAAAKIKRRFPYVYSFTRAHSFEIDPLKNPYYFAGGKNYVHKYIDEILFISNAGKQFYLDSIINKYSSVQNILYKKCQVYRLGTTKKYNTITRHSTDGILRVVSCSRIDPEKRVELIAEVVKNWTYSRIEWTHFGGGDIKAVEKRLDGINETEVSVKLMGFCENEQIHEFYSKNPIDVFLSLSYSEGVPVSMMEAQSYGIPIVATNVGGVSEIVDNENGLLLSPDSSIEQIIKSLSFFLFDFSSEREIERKRSLSYRNWMEKYSEQFNDSLLLEHITEEIRKIRNNYS